MGYRQEQGAVAGGVGSQQLGIINQLNDVTAQNAANAASAEANAEAAQLAAENARDAALIAQTAAETAETNAETAEASAANSAANASANAIDSNNNRIAAQASAASAASSASAAATSATNAANSASSAANSSTNAASSASSAAMSATNAASSLAATEAVYDQFDDRYLGVKAANPTLDNDGNALVVGALYFNSVSNEMRVWNGTNWQAAAASTTKKESFTATAGQILFNVTGGYTVGFLDVYVNGVRFLSGTDYTATDGSTFTMATGLTAGDIVEVVAFGVFDLANMVEKTGDVMTGNYSITGDVSITGTLSADNIVPSTPFSFRNKIINGGFDIWQRGDAQSTDGYASADRWGLWRAGHTMVMGRTGSSALYVVRSVVSGTNQASVYQKIEGLRKFSGKTVTVSFTGLMESGSSKTFAVGFILHYGTGGSPSASEQVTAQAFVATTAEQRFSFTFTIPSLTAKTFGTNGDDSLEFYIGFPAAQGTFGSGSAFVVNDIQVEEGDVATPFEQRPIGLELSLCERYYEVATYLQMSSYGATANFFGTVYRWRTRKRVNPVVTIGTTTFSNASDLTVANQYADSVYLYAKVTATGPAVWVADSVRADAEL